MSIDNLPPKIKNALKMYTQLGLDAVPILEGQKRPTLKGWPSKPAITLWERVSGNVQIALRGGGIAQAAFLDCDEKDIPGTFANAQDWLADLGIYDYPVVATASGIGRHIYLRFNKNQLSKQSRKLAENFGAGEFRYGSGAYVLAPPSIVDGREYRLLSGDLSRIPFVHVDQVMPILKNQDTSPAPKKKILSRKATALLNGVGIEKYDSRSEAEQALLLSLVNSGFEFPQVLVLFDKKKAAGKYSELKSEDPQNARRWLEHSYDEAVKYASRHPDGKTRQSIQALIEWAKSTAWVGRIGANDRAAFISLAEIAYKAGRLQVAASCRDIGVLAGMSKTAASNALYRLITLHGLIELVAQAQGLAANEYRLKGNEIAKLGHSPSTPIPVRKCPSFASHDAFRKGKGKDGLGKSAGLIWEQLQEHEALTVDELINATGKQKRTIESNLKRMSKIIDRKTGEVFQMVASDDDITWHVLPVDLDAVAVAVGTGGATDKQKRLHTKERKEHERSLLLSRLKDDNQLPSGDSEKV